MPLAMHTYTDGGIGNNNNLLKIYNSLLIPAGNYKKVAKFKGGNHYSS